MIDMLPTLGDGLMDVIVPAIIFAVITIASIVKGVLESKPAQKQKQQRGATQRNAQEQEASQGRLSDLAERRRRQLQELARRRREGGAPQAMGQQTPPPPPRTRPSSTMPSEREVQAEALRRRQAEAMRRRQVEAERRQREMAAAREARQREAEKSNRQSALARREAELARQRELRQRQFTDAEAQRMSVDESPVGVHQEVHRHVRDAAYAKPAAGASLEAKLKSLDRPVLQQAIILKELLDRPVALRDDDAGVGFSYI